jgi:hypothetical protein
MMMSGLGVHAQSIPVFEDATVNLSPEYPGPFEPVEISLVSFSIPLDTRMITWYVDGVETARSVGKKSLTVRTKAIGTVTRVVAVIELNGVQKVTKIVELKPNSVDLLWEAIDSYVPPFYRGKALPSAEGALRVTAFAVGAENQNGLVYTWLRNNVVSQSDSGFGRNALTGRNNVLQNSTDVGVRVISADGTFQAENRIVIPRAEPFVRFKIANPGISELYTTAPQITIPFDQFTITAEPFYMSSRSGNYGLSFEWTANDIEVPITSGGNTPELYLSNPGEGVINLSVTANHERFILQEAQKSLTIGFR